MPGFERAGGAKATAVCRLGAAHKRTLFPQRAQLIKSCAHFRGGQARRALKGGRPERRRRESKAAARAAARGALHQRNAHARALDARKRRLLLPRLGRLQHRGGREEGARRVWLC